MMTNSKLTEMSIHMRAAQKYKELLALITLIRERPVPKNILEIGTSEGGTFWLWCRLAATDGKIISIDMPLAEHTPDFIEHQKKQFESYKTPGQSVFFIREDSHTQDAEDKLLSFLGDELCDIIFIDGDHTLHGVTDDFERYKKYISDGGLIVFHDIVYHNRCEDCRVNILWDCLKEGNDTAFELIDDEEDDRGWGTWGGIGVLVNE
jgi:predicted O-methyltransferase YrrM